MIKFITLACVLIGTVWSYDFTDTEFSKYDLAFSSSKRRKNEEIVSQQFMTLLDYITRNQNGLDIVSDVEQKGNISRRK